MFLSCVFFPPPPSFFVTAMSVVTVVSMANGGYSETKGKHVQYSKFFHSNSEKSAAKQAKVSSRNGMLVLYTPAFLAGLSSFWLFPDEGFRFLLLKSALTFHFFKRIFEVLFIHKYSGSMTLESAIVITVSYFISTATMIFSQHLSQGLPEPSIDFKYFGVIVFLLGIIGNFYHHLLLSEMRKDGEKQYKIPNGGLFDKVVCPHYLFEILVFWGFAFISQTLYAFSIALGTSFYLIGRSFATRNWYQSKFENFPKDVKAVFPYLL
ncbi:steroid 5-alpha-reductase DET2-like isoform X2 [Mangifera indica]|uniref:steroid 5-alpha-reductase DET2-like isoform X2 n=1 Tax=Mangifera indica TaxID=29780 RepID=UPI001CF95A8B|nr:steroid 5-alpha-reductase DET2-like isoform X2 [Mangifera indica]